VEAGGLVEASEAHLAAGVAAAARSAAAGAASVLDLPLLPGIDGTWAERVRRRHGDLWRRAVEVRASAALELGDAAGALSAAQRALEAAPFRESLHRLVMSAHWAVGNRALALRAYEACRRLLAEELGVDPSPATEELYLQLLGRQDDLSGTD
jgi:DNA-binding SARP family transcriptional activator